MKKALAIAFVAVGVAAMIRGVVALHDGVHHFPRTGRGGGGTPYGIIVMGGLFLIAAIAYGVLGSGKDSAKERAEADRDSHR